MAIVFEGAADGGNNSNGTGWTFAYTVNANANRLLVVGFVGDVNGGADDITGVTYAGTAMTLVQKIGTGSGHNMNRNVYMYFLLSPASGANNVVISCSGAHYILAGAADYSGVFQSGQPDNSAINEGSAASCTTSLTTVADNCWTVLVEGEFDANAPPVAGAGSTRRAFDAVFGTWGIFDSNAPVTPAGSYSMTTTRSGSEANLIQHIIASFAPAAPVVVASNAYQ